MSDLRKINLIILEEQKEDKNVVPSLFGRETNGANGKRIPEEVSLS